MKKLLVPLILICALLVPVGMLGGISCVWNLETLYVQDIYGNRSALLPYTVTGNLGDDVHNLSFTLSQGKMQRDVSFGRAEETPPEKEEWKAEIVK